MQADTIQAQLHKVAGNRMVRQTSALLFWLLVLVYTPFCLALIAVKWFGLPEVDRYRSEIQAFLEQQTGAPLVLGTITANWQGLGPQLVVRNVSLPMPNGEVGFQASSIRLDFSLSSILAFNPRLKNLEIDSPILHLKRNSEGVLEVAGIPVIDDGSEGNPGLDWLLVQQRVLLHGGILEWEDELGHVPDGRATDAEFLLENNSLGRHKAGLRFQMPLLGDVPVLASLNFKTPLLDRSPSDFSGWKGVFFLKAEVAQTAPLVPLFKRFGLNLDATRPQGSLWVDFSGGAIQKTLLDAKVARLSFSNASAKAAPFEISNASAQIELQGENALFHPSALTVRNLNGQLADSTRLGPTNFSLSKTRLEQGVEWGVGIQQLDAGQARVLALELGPHLEQKERLEELKTFEITGRVNKGNLQWRTAGDSPLEPSLSFQSDIDFSQLTILYQETPVKGRVKTTGFRNVSGSFRGSDSSGEWVLTGVNSQLQLPEIFEAEGLYFDSLQGRGSWRDVFSPGQPAEFRVQHLEVANSDLNAEVQGIYQFRRGESDVVDMKGKLKRAEFAKVSNYLPLVIGASARQWLSENLKAGLARDGEFELSGRLDDFPFDGSGKKGVFRIEVPFQNAELTYAPGWPSIQKVNGKATFNSKRMLIQASTAESLGVGLRNVQAKIDNMDAWEPLLEVRGEGQGELARMVSFVNQSPVREILSEALVNAQVEGNANLVLQLSIPIASPDNTQVKGDLKLKGNSVRIVRSMPTVTQVDGLIQFSNQGLFMDQLQGQALGGPVVINGTTDSTGRMEIRATGTARARGLAQYLNPLTEPYLAGSTPYSVLVATRESGMSIEVSSQLQGLEVKLPSPFDKKADSRLPLRLTQTSTPESERWQVDLGAETKPLAQLRAVVTSEQGSAGIDSLQFAIGAPLSPPVAGFQGEIQVPSINLDTWRSIFADLTSASGNTGLMGTLMTGGGEVDPGLKLKVAISTGRLEIGSKSFESVSVAARTVERRWQFDVKAKGVDGYLSWVADKQRPDGAVLARFKTLVIPKTLDKDMRELVEEPASSIPALDVQVENFTLNDLSLGRLKLTAVNQSREEQAKAVLNERPKEWRLEELRIENAESVTRAKGIWQYGDSLKTQRTDIEVDQSVKNAGGLMTRLGMAGVFQGGEGSLVGRLRWNDAPTNIDYASLSGQFRLKSTKGQFLKADPGVAKLLGVLSLQSIPRRLTLDFKDVFSEGFAYDNMDADVVLKEGVASTRNFKMTGPSATVVMDGKLDLERETQNLNVVVLPDLNPAGGSLIYSVMAANPAVGIASLIADFVFKDPLSRIFSFQYRVSGPWTAPVIERVRRSDVQEESSNSVTQRP